MGKERRLERGLAARPLQITESEGATGMASVCAILALFVCPYEVWMKMTIMKGWWLVGLFFLLLLVLVPFEQPKRS